MAFKGGFLELHVGLMSGLASPLGSTTNVDPYWFCWTRDLEFITVHQHQYNHASTMVVLAWIKPSLGVKLSLESSLALKNFSSKWLFRSKSVHTQWNMLPKSTSEGVTVSNGSCQSCLIWNLKFILFAYVSTICLLTSFLIGSYHEMFIC